MTISTEHAEQQSQIMYADIMRQLLESDRFQVFFSTNYDLQRVVDDENKEIVFMVVEVPPEVVIGRLKEKSKEIENQKNKIMPIDSGLTIAKDTDLKKYS